MLTPVRLLPLLFALLPLALQAQSTQADLEARLLHKPLYLRNLWRGDNLHFDANGHLLGDQAHISFTLSGIELDKLIIKDGKLVLQGRRIGLEFHRDVPKRITLRHGAMGGPEEVKIEVDPSSDFTPALDLIFADSLVDLVPTLPFYWQPYAQTCILGKPEPATAKPPLVGTSASNVTAPKVIRSVDPVFSDAARQLDYGGSTLVKVTIGDTGKITQASVVRPLGLGLDEQALAAVVQYQFEPARKGGQPISVEVRFEVNFNR